MELNFYCCSFCYQNVDEGELDKEEVDEVLARFTKLVFRYFGRKNSGDLVRLELESCQECLSLMTSFCDLYHQLKCLELEVEWRLCRLKQVMSSANKVKVRKENFRRSWRRNGGEDGMEAVEGFRKDLIESCRSLTTNSFPKVNLTRSKRKRSHLELDIISDKPEPSLPLDKSGVDEMVMDLVTEQNDWSAAIPSLVQVDDNHEDDDIPGVEPSLGFTIVNEVDLPEDDTEVEGENSIDQRVVTQLTTATDLSTIALSPEIDIKLEFPSSLPESPPSPRPMRAAASLKPCYVEEDCKNEGEDKSDDDDFQVDDEQVSEEDDDEVALPKQSYKCSKCLLFFDTEQEVASHLHLHGNFSCSETTCEFTTTFAVTLAEHELSTHCESETPKTGTGSQHTTCPRCPHLEFSKLRSYINHFLEVHLSLPAVHEVNKCPICKTCFTFTISAKWRRLRRAHMDEHHNIKGMDPASVPRCKECPAYFRRHKQLLDHSRNVHNAQILQCWDCGTKVATPRDLRRHRIHVHKLNPADFPLACDVPECGERFEIERDLEIHKTNRHSSKFKNKNDKLPCNVCGKKFSGLAGLKAHKRIHEDDHHQKLEEKRKKQRTVCEECGKEFKNGSRLEQHKTLVHLGPEHWKFQCDICGKKCFDKTKLTQHSRIHLKDTKVQFICDLCGASYSHAHNLRLHKKNKHEGSSKTVQNQEEDDDNQ